MARRRATCPHSGKWRSTSSTQPESPGCCGGHGLDWSEGLGRLVMIGVGLTLLYLGIRRKFEPLLLVPIGFGAVLANIPLAGLSEPGGLLYYIYEVGIVTGIFPLIIFMGVGAMTDFGPLLANPKTALLGGAAQFGIFCDPARCTRAQRDSGH